MLNKPLCLGLILSMIIVTGRTPLVASGKAEEAGRTQKVRTAIAKLGTGPSARVKMVLQDKSKLKGYIKEAHEEHFVLVQNTGATSEVAYSQVKQVQGNNLSTGAKIAIGVGVGLVIFILIFKDRIDSY